MSKYLKVDSLSKHYKDKKVLNNISFNVNKGQIIGLVGKNGAGKSTVLKILSLILDFEGDVLIEGISIKTSKNLCTIWYNLVCLMRYNYNQTTAHARSTKNLNI